MAEEESNGVAPFNMALSTLEKIHKSLMEITHLTLIKDQHSKFRMIKQLHLQSSFLITSKDGKKSMKGIKEKLTKIKLPFIQVMRYGRFVKMEEDFNQKLDYDLDDFVEQICSLLQNSGNYLMPSTKDPRYNWKQD